jgi:hypothetical protein
MNPHREWFCEYEKYNGVDDFIGDESTTRIVGHEKVKFFLKDRRIRILPKVLRILELDRNLIFVSKMSDASVHIVFERETCKIVRGEMVLLRGVENGTLYKLLGNTITDGCNIFFVPEGINEEHTTPNVSRENIML